jgi:hypothetical protein
MTKLRVGRFVLILLGCGAAFGVLAAIVTRSVGIPSSSTPFVGGAVVAGGILCTIVLVNLMVRRGRFKWLLKS